MAGGSVGQGVCRTGGVYGRGSVGQGAGGL